MTVLDVHASLPSIDWGGLRRVPNRMGLPQWLVRVVFATHEGSRVKVLLQGQRARMHIGISRNIKQGFAASGSHWAIGYDPVIRCPFTLRPAPDGQAVAFADEIGLAARFVAAHHAPLLHAGAHNGRVRRALQLNGCALLGRFRHRGASCVASANT